MGVAVSLGSSGVSVNVGVALGICDGDGVTVSEGEAGIVWDGNGVSVGDGGMDCAGAVHPAETLTMRRTNNMTDEKQGFIPTSPSIIAHLSLIRIRYCD